MKSCDKRIVWCKRIQKVKWKWNNHNIQYVRMIDLGRNVQESVNWV